MSVSSNPSLLVSGKETVPEHAGNQTCSVAFVSKWDMLLLRFALQLRTASDQFFFSTRRYAFLTGQLRSTHKDDVRKLANNGIAQPTDATNVHDRLLMCLTRGAYCVERALIVLNTHTNKHLRQLKMSQVLQSNRLSLVVINLAVSIFDENQWYSGKAGVSRFLFKDMPNVQKQYIDAAVYTVSASDYLTENEISSESLEPVTSTIAAAKQLTDGNARNNIMNQIGRSDEMTKEEIVLFERLQYQTLAPLHHFLRICVDATNFKESEVMLMSLSGNTPQHLWDIPFDTPVDCLIFHAQKPLVTAITKQVQSLYTMYKLLKKKTHTKNSWNITSSSSSSSSSTSSSSSSSSSLFFTCENDAFSWILSDTKRRVLFANLVACDVYDGLCRNRRLHTNKTLVNRIRTNYNDLTMYFQLLLSV